LNQDFERIASGMGRFGCFPVPNVTPRHTFTSVPSPSVPPAVAPMVRYACAIRFNFNFQIRARLPMI